MDEKFKIKRLTTILLASGILILLLYISFYVVKDYSKLFKGSKQSKSTNSDSTTTRGQKQSGSKLKKTKYSSSLFKISQNIRHFDDRDTDSLVKALNKSIQYFKKKPKRYHVRYGSHKVPVKKIIRMTADIRDGVTKWGTGKKFTSWLNKNFVFLQAQSPSFYVTGYYLPLIRGSKTKTRTFKYPLYKAPDDLVRVRLKDFDFHKKIDKIPSTIKGRLAADNSVTPYWTRKEIDYDKRLVNQNNEIAWTDDPVALHNLHVQGSGVIEFQDKTRKYYGYGNSNGHRFRGIGGHLLNSSILPEGINTPVEINEFLLSKPELWEETFSINPRYLFFRKLKGLPVGSIGVEITEHRTIAADQNIYPSGGIALLETSIPVVGKNNEIIKWKKIKRFVLNQDSGNAIKGKNHIDLFCGFGDKNKTIASSLRQKGKIWFLLKKNLIK